MFALNEKRYVNLQKAGSKLLHLSLNGEYKFSIYILEDIFTRGLFKEDMFQCHQELNEFVCKENSCQG